MAYHENETNEETEATSEVVETTNEEVDASTSLNDEATVVYSFYIESNNEGVVGLSPTISNFIDIDSLEDLVSNETQPSIIEVGAGFYKFSYSWNQTSSPRAFLVKIDSTLDAAPEKYITMRIERSDYLPSVIKRIADIEQGTWELSTETNQLIIKHAVTQAIIGKWDLFDASGVVGTTRSPFYRKAKIVSPY